MYNRGFTYIELLLVMAITGIILSFSVVMSYNSISRSTVLQERDLFVSLLLTGARSQAIANVNEQSHGIHIDNAAKQYILFDGTAYDPDDSANRITPFTNEHIAVTHSSNDEDIIFEQLSGNVNEGIGTVTITDGNATQEIIINEVGQINW